MYLRILSVFVVSFICISCSFVGYLWGSFQGQMDLLDKSLPIEEALKKYNFNEDEKKKLELVPKIKKFALEKSKNRYR